MAEEGVIRIPRHKPDSRELFFFFLSGIIVSIPLTTIVDIFPTRICSSLPAFYSQVCSVAIFAPFIEEFSKAYPLFYRHGETERSLLTLAFLVGLGFGVTEFFIYVFGLGASPIIRLPGVFFHASSTTITIYGLAVKRPVIFYLIAVALHFSYNFSALLGPVWFIGGPIALLITYLLALHFYRISTEEIIY